MGDIIDQLGNREKGQLITKEDWNALVETLEGVRDALSAQLGELEDQVQAGFEQVGEQLDALGGRIDALETTVDVLRRQYRVRLRTNRLNYALGEMVEIEALVTDFEGNPLDMGALPGRPWVDFVATWGQFKPADGFASRGGVGDRAISVQINAEGVARIRLRAEHAEGLSDDDDDEIVAALQTPIQVINSGGQTITKSVAQVFLDAETPRAVQTNTQAYKVMTQEYQRVDSKVFGKYLDAYYLDKPKRVTGFFPGFHHRWRDYRATVTAIAKDDGDPRTPDEGRGYSSIQVTFRDWIDPWVHLDFLDEIGTLAQSFRDQLVAEIGDSYLGSIQGLQNKIQGIVAKQGIIGKVRGYQAVQHALDGIVLDDEPDFLDDLLDYTQHAVKFEQTMVYSQANTIGGAAEEGPGLAMFTTAAVQNNKSAGDLKAGIDEVGRAISNAQAQAEAIVAGAEKRIGASVETLEQRLGERVSQLDTQIADQTATIREHAASLTLLDTRTESAQQTASQLDSRITTVSDQVQMLESFDVIDVQNKMADLRVVQTSLQQARENIIALQQAIGNG